MEKVAFLCKTMEICTKLDVGVLEGGGSCRIECSSGLFIEADNFSVTVYHRTVEYISYERRGQNE